jgi:hypothetical protein
MLVHANFPDGAVSVDRFQRARKAIALLIAVLLISGFVLYRAGIIGPVYMSSSKSTFMFVGSSIKPPDEKAVPANQTESEPPLIPYAKP